MPTRACVYLDLEDENGETRTVLRICGPSETIGGLQTTAETCFDYGEKLIGVRVYYEDPIKTKKQSEPIIIEGHK